MALRELRIDNTVVFSSAQVDFGDGFTVLSGETGSGKSVCITALRLALGERMDGDPIRRGAARARIAAVFDAVPPQGLNLLESLGISADDGVVTVVRDIPREGRSSCRINGALVSITALRDLGEILAEVTAQGASQRLLRHSWQRDQLDRFGGEGVAAARSAVASAYEEWRAATEAHRRASERSRLSARERDAARALIEELDPAALRIDDVTELTAERQLLRHAVTLGEVLAGLETAAGGDAAGGAVATLSAATSRADSLRAAIPELDALCRRADAVVEELQDLGADARRLGGLAEPDPRRLDAVEERLAFLSRIERRFGSLAQAQEALAEAHAVVDAEEGNVEIERVARRAAEAETALARTAASLSQIRRRRARGLDAAIERQLAQLDLAGSRFQTLVTRRPDPAGVEIEGERVAVSPLGVDEISFTFASSKKAPAQPLEAVASGGELSRIALALRAVVTSADCPTLVLDEVDTGIGGETAAHVGELLAGIADHRQVITVTHRPEIAARAQEHRLVVREPASDPPVSTVRTCTGEARRDEIARLMSGRLTDAARQRAAELLVEGRRRASDAAQVTPPAA